MTTIKLRYARSTTKIAMCAAAVLAALTLAAAHATAASAASTLPSNAGLQPSQGLMSPDGEFSLVMGGDGTLVEYQGKTILWTDTPAPKVPGAVLVMGGDGTLVVYKGNGNLTKLWATPTGGHPGAYLTVQDDGNVVVYSPSNQALWANYAKLARPPAFKCFTARNQRYQSGVPNVVGTYWEELLGEVCYNYKDVGANNFHALLQSLTPAINATITGAGAFKGGYTGPNGPPSPAVTLWANDYIHSPGVLETEFRPVLEEWRYPRVWVTPSGATYECTWWTKRFNLSVMISPPPYYTEIRGTTPAGCG